MVLVRRVAIASLQITLAILLVWGSYISTSVRDIRLLADRHMSGGSIL